LDRRRLSDVSSWVQVIQWIPDELRMEGADLYSRKTLCLIGAQRQANQRSLDEAHRVLDTIKDRLGMRIAVYEVAIKPGVIDQIS